MYKDNEKKYYLILILLVVLAAGVFLAWPRGGNSRAETAGAIRQAVIDRATQCYAIEGVYPPSLEYLEENYGLTINTASYYVHYEIFAENLPPIVRVVSKGAGR